jgi:XTP/dITP diphosphohydrolase
MRGAPDRTARFVCVAALAKSGQLVRTFRGEVEGRLTEEPHGSDGFGYDPLFFYPPFGSTLGEVSLDRKMEVSHRSKALRAMLDFLTGTGSG